MSLLTIPNTFTAYTKILSSQMNANFTAISTVLNAAASTNTAGTLVLRDGSGNFAAGTITATLTGNVTGNVSGNVSGTAANITGIAAIANGGTGQSTANAGFNALSPMTTGGDLIYGGASGVATRLANGSSGQVLTSNGGTAAPTWTSPLVNPMTTIGDLLYGGASGAVTRLAGDTSNTRKFLRTLSASGTAAAPVWDTHTYGDLKPALIPPSLETITSGSSGTSYPHYVFIVTSANATVGATYTNNSQTFTVLQTISGQTQLACTAASTTAPLASGTLTKASGTGDATITYSAFANPIAYRLRLVGGGGGGGSPTGTNGSAGGNTTFGTSLLVANGGSSNSGGSGGAGGTASLGTGPVGVAYAGPPGAGAVPAAGSVGGSGGGTPFFTSGTGGNGNSTGTSGAANSGAGGGGGGGGGGQGYGGGGAGGFIDAMITNTSAAWATSWAWALGAGGAGGTGTPGGGAGGSGIIERTGYYQ